MRGAAARGGVPYLLLLCRMYLVGIVEKSSPGAMARVREKMDIVSFLLILRGYCALNSVCAEQIRSRRIWD